MAAKSDYSFLGWAIGIAALLWFASRGDSKDVANESTALSRRLSETGREYTAVEGAIDTDEFRLPPIMRDYSRPGPDGIRNPFLPVEKNIYAVDELTGGDGETEYYQVDFLGRRLNPL